MIIIKVIIIKVIIISSLKIEYGKGFDPDETLIIFDDFPVGKVDFMHLYSLNFYEFICAMGENQFAKLLETDDYEMINAYSVKYLPVQKVEKT